jgi:hypothetical protein
MGTRKNRFLYCRQAFWGTGNLDKQVRTLRPCKEFFRCAERVFGITGQQGRYFQGYPPINSVGLIVFRPEKISRPREILHGHFEEQILIEFALRHLFPNRIFICRAVSDGVLENRRVRGETRDRELIDITLERASVQQVPGDVIEPEALS